MNQIEAKEYITKNCGDLTFRKPLTHWKILRDNKKYCDMWLGVGGFDEKGQRRPLGNNLKSYAEYDNLRKEYTGNFFTNNNGNLIYIGNFNDPQTQIILNKKWLGDAFEFKAQRNNSSRLKGSGWFENFSKHMFSPASEKHIGFDRVEIANGIRYWSFRHLLEIIEDSPNKFPKEKPIIILWSDEEIVGIDKISQNIVKFITENQKYFDGLFLALAVIPGVGTATAISLKGAFEGLKKMVGQMALGKSPSASEITEVCGPIMNFAGIDQKDIQKGLDIGKKIEKGDYFSVANDLGISEDKIKDIVGSVSGKGNAGYIVNGLKTGNFNDVQKQLGVLKALGTVKEATTIDNGKNYVQKNGTTSPVYANISTLSLSGNIGLLPNITEIADGILTDTKTLLTKEDRASWINAGSMKIDATTQLSDLAFSNLTLQALDSKKKNIPYVLPAEIPAQYKPCITANLIASTGVQIIDTAKRNPPVPLPPPNQQTKKKKKKIKKEFR
jgi:hypothetical protein